MEEIAKIEFEDESKEIAKEEPLKPNKEIVADVANIDRSDFDLFVLRVHVLSLRKMQKKWSQRLTKEGFRHLQRSLVLRKTFMRFMWDLLLRRVT